MTWQTTPAAELIRRAADLNDIDPERARLLWAAAAPLEIRAADEAADELYRIERLLSAATCLLEAGRFTLCMIVLEALLPLNLDHAQLDQVELLFHDAFFLAMPPEPCGKPS